MTKTWDEFKNEHPGDPEAVAAHRQRMEKEVDEYSEKLNRSLWLSDLRIVVSAMEKIAAALPSNFPGSITDASFTVTRADGEDLAEVWWDGENEEWLADWNRRGGRE